MCSYWATVCAGVGREGGEEGASPPPQLMEQMRCCWSRLCSFSNTSRPCWCFSSCAALTILTGMSTIRPAGTHALTCQVLPPPPPPSSHPRFHPLMPRNAVLCYFRRERAPSMSWLWRQVQVESTENWIDLDSVDKCVAKSKGTRDAVSNWHSVILLCHQAHHLHTYKPQRLQQPGVQTNENFHYVKHIDEQ